MSKEKEPLVPQAPADIFEMCTRVIETSQRPKSSVASACRRHNVSYEWLVEQLGRYEDLSKLAREAGIKTWKAHHVLKKRNPENSDSSVPYDIAIEARNAKSVSKAQRNAIEAFVPSKEQALTSIIEMLAKGANFRTAAAKSGAREVDIRRWILENPDLVRTFKQAEAVWAEKFFDSLNVAIVNAAEKGNVKDLLAIAERKFADWMPAGALTPEAAKVIKDAESIEVQAGLREAVTTSASSGNMGIVIEIEGEEVVDAD